jgi:hypothetical protein
MVHTMLYVSLNHSPSVYDFNCGSTKKHSNCMCTQWQVMSPMVTLLSLALTWFKALQDPYHGSTMVVSVILHLILFCLRSREPTMILSRSNGVHHSTNPSNTAIYIFICLICSSEVYTSALRTKTNTMVWYMHQYHGTVVLVRAPW